MQQKKITGIAIFLTLIILVFYCFFLHNNDMDTTISQFQKETKQHNTHNNTTSKWSTYVDKDYEFTIEYPLRQVNNTSDEYTIQVFEEYDKFYKGSEKYGVKSYTADKNISFSPGGDGWNIMRIAIIESTPFNSTYEWMQEENKLEKRILTNNKSVDSMRVMEKTINIDGHSALVTFVQSVHEYADTFRHEKKTVLIKNGVLYEINTRLNDYERILNSISFTN